jgi:hypothetical protein
MIKPIPARVPKSDWLQVPGRSDGAYEEDARNNVPGVVLGVAVGAGGARDCECEERAEERCDPARVSARPSRAGVIRDARSRKDSHMLQSCAGGLMRRTDDRGKATAKVEGGERRQRWMRLSFERGARSEERVPWFAAEREGARTPPWTTSRRFLFLTSAVIRSFHC